MKIFNALVLVVLFCAEARVLSAQDPATTDGDAKNGDPAASQLYTLKIRVPPTFIALDSVGGAPADPFADPVAAPPKRGPGAKEILENAGVEFGAGCFASYNPIDSTLTVRNTASQLDLVELYCSQPGQEPIKQLPIIAEFIEVDFARWNDWIFENRISTDGTELRKEVQQWKKAGDADIIETVIVNARPGQRAKTEAAHELIYPTEMGGPGEIPNKVTLSGKETKAPTTGAAATAFETRKLGTIFEVDPVLGADNFTIDLNLSPELVKLHEYAHWPGEDGDVNTTVSMPIFRTTKVTTQVTTVAGHYTLVGASRAREALKPNREKPYVLIFARGDVSHVTLTKKPVATVRIPFKPEK